MPYENPLGRYAVFASVAPLASAAVTNSVVADIYHQADVGLIVGGFGAFPEAKLLSIPEYGAMRVIAGHDSQGPGYFFALGEGDPKGSKSGKAQIQPLVDLAGGTITTGYLRRFDTGELIDGAGDRSVTAIGATGSDGVFAAGPFAGGGPGYMGISIKVEDADGTEFRYGWIALDWDVTTFELTIEAFAYETEAGVGIAAGAIPAPGAMGLFGLAAGAAGIRRKRQA